MWLHNPEDSEMTFKRIIFTYQISHLKQKTWHWKIKNSIAIFHYEKNQGTLETSLAL